MDGLNTGDTAWILISTALVLMMTPALGFFYGGMVRRKNILSTLNLSVIMMGVISIQWVLIGYSLAFGSSVGGLFGGFDHIGLAGITYESMSGSIPTLLFVAFQMTFAIITPALITGAFVERVRFRAYLVFAVLWATFVYDPVCYWVWGGGMFTDMALFGMPGVHALDFAGGNVVHITAGYSALVFAFMIRKRQGFGTSAIQPHNITFTVLGAGLLWVGWFGFNGGSALAADGLAALALINTNTAAAACMVVWMLLAWRDEKPSVLGMVTGAVCGLVAITPAAGWVTPMYALIIGAVAAPISYYAINFREHRGWDESLDVWACHGMAGTWGALATGLFASVGAEGLIFGGVTQFVAQVVSIIVTIAYAVIITYVILKIIDSTIGLSVTEDEEQVGLDISEHGERAYS
ncbi:MAG: ammonium transporter [Chloroflexota bacterium]